jgi:hypothetical protein
MTDPYPHTGQPLLLPLTGSLYASGQISDTGKVLVDIGTGYYVEVRDPAPHQHIHTTATCQLTHHSITKTPPTASPPATCSSMHVLLFAA